MVITDPTVWESQSCKIVMGMYLLKERNDTMLASQVDIFEVNFWKIFARQVICHLCLDLFVLGDCSLYIDFQIDDFLHCVLEFRHDLWAVILKHQLSSAQVILIPLDDKASVASNIVVMQHGPCW